jgi:iron complex transport system substrate-binding protein
MTSADHSALVRVLSLLPSATEIVYALGAQDSLCGVSCDCDYPEEVAGKPVVSARVLPISSDTPPGEIDKLVRDQVQAGDSIYSLDRSLIQELRPQVILAQDLCRVCAVPSGHVQDALDVIGCTAEVLSLDPHSLDDVLESVSTVGGVLGMRSRAESVTAGLRSRLARVQRATGGAVRKRVVTLEWQEPLFNGGHWIPEMIEIAGGRDAFGAPGESSRTVTWSEVEAATPDVIVYMPCGYNLQDAVAQVPALYDVEEFASTPAATAGNVYVTDSSAYFSRSGPRLIDGVEILAGCLHPERFSPPPQSRALRVVQRDSGIEISAVS